jgi:hypothetical protein
MLAVSVLSTVSAVVSVVAVCGLGSIVDDALVDVPRMRCSNAGVWKIFSRAELSVGVVPKR